MKISGRTLYTLTLLHGKGWIHKVHVDFFDISIEYNTYVIYSQLTNNDQKGKSSLSIMKSYTQARSDF